MRKYNWTIDDLKNLLKLLEKKRTLETEPQKLDLLLIDINDLKDFILELECEEPENMSKLLDNYASDKKELSSFKFLWEDIRFFHETVSSSIKNPPLLKTVSLSKKDLLDLTHDFYKEYLDKFFFHNFLKQFRQRFNHIKFDENTYSTEYMGESIHIGSLGETFISIMRDYDIEDALTCIHEYEHATSIVINPYHVHGLNRPFCELDPLFMEMIGADYLESIFKDGEAIKAKASNHETQCLTSELLSSKINLVKAEELHYKDGYTSNKILKESAKKYCGLVSEDVDDLIQYSSLPYDYSISYIFAVELYNMFQNDRDKALYYLKKIIYLNCKTELEYYNELKKMGFIPNLHMREFHHSINESILKLEKKN